MIDESKLSFPLEPEYADGGYRVTNATEEWYEWARENITPIVPDKHFEIAYVATRKYDDGYEQLVVCVRSTNHSIVVEKNKPLPLDRLVSTQLMFTKLYPDPE